jgi:hypothetical protein
MSGTLPELSAPAIVGARRSDLPSISPKPIPVTPTAQSSPLPAEHAEAARV